MSATQAWIKQKFEEESKANPPTDVWTLKRTIEKMDKRIKQLETDVAWLQKGQQ